MFEPKEFRPNYWPAWVFGWGATVVMAVFLAAGIAHWMMGG